MKISTLIGLLERSMRRFGDVDVNIADTELERMPVDFVNYDEEKNVLIIE